MSYNPDQPREPAGSPIGGRWVSEGYGGDVAAAVAAGKAAYLKRASEYTEDIRSKMEAGWEAMSEADKLAYAAAQGIRPPGGELRHLDIQNAEAFLVDRADEIPREEDFLVNGANAMLDPEQDEAVTDDITDTTDATRGKIKAGIVANLGARLEEKGITPQAANDFRSDMAVVTRMSDDAYQRAAQAFVDKWAGTSGDTDYRAVAIQERAAALFNLESHGYWNDRSSYYDQDQYEAFRRNVDDFKAAHTPVIDALLHSTYENTQAQLEHQGLSDVTLFRGMSGSTGETQPETFAPAMIRLQPLSSFSSNRDTARAFGFTGEARGSLMAVTVPRAQVFSTCVTGPGCLPESEYIIMGQPGGVRGMVYELGSRARTSVRPSPSSPAIQNAATAYLEKAGALKPEVQPA